MKRHRARLALVTALCTAAGAAADYDPFRISRERFEAEVSTIAIAEPRLWNEVGDEEEVADRIVFLVAKELRDAGYTVVEPVEYEERWRRHAEALGGVFDPATGLADDEALRLAYEYTARELAADLDVDAMLRPSVYRRPVEVGWFRPPRTFVSYLELYAAGEPVLWGGEIARRSVIDDTPELWPQNVVGRWIGTSIYDASGVELYDIACSIGWEKVYMHRGFEERSLEALFRPGRLLEAVRRCLEPLDFSPPEPPESGTPEARVHR